MPLVGVGLLYAEGYFHQELDADGWQHERNERIDPEALGVQPTGVEVHVDLAGVDVTVRVWRVDAGRIPLYLLDTNVAGNPPEAIAVTDRLYGGDEQHRLRQEIILGIGGVRALRALDIHPQVFHTNEGHAGFLGLERIREWIGNGLSFAEAIEAVRAGSLFTTHTPVPAGIDRFSLELFTTYFATFADQCGVGIDELIALGQGTRETDKFNMALMGLRLAARANGVARLHGEVSREMFGWLWPDLPTKEIPIGHVTNGVHARSWVSDRVDELLGELIGEEWHLADENDWARVKQLDHHDVWNVRNQGRRELVDLVRRLTGEDVLDPGVLTIGFARRFATYKRSTLLLSQMERLKALLLDSDRPVQFVFAGKAHPADEPGKAMIREIDRLARSADVHHRFVFIPDYDIGIARTMYHGCDVWLNTPRATHGGLRHERHEGRTERRPELLDPRRLVGRDVGGPQRLRHPVVRRRSRTSSVGIAGRRRRRSTSSSTRSSRRSTGAVTTACRTTGSIGSSRTGRRSAGTPSPAGWFGTTSPSSTSRRPSAPMRSPQTPPARHGSWPSGRHGSPRRGPACASRSTRPDPASNPVSPAPSERWSPTSTPGRCRRRI